MLNEVKLALRISHNKLESEIQSTIDAAKAEMVRAGVVETSIVETDPLIADAIKTYCKYSFASDVKVREGFFESWQYQLENIRKSEGYGWVSDDV